MSDRAHNIAAALNARFSPARLEVVDQSGLHAGHSGARPEGGTHFRVEIVADAFDGMSRLERHRAVNDALAGEFETGLHALVIEARAPSEA